jgi:hypothetical protein
MRPVILLLVLVVALAFSAALYWLSGGKLLFLGLPLVFVGPLAFRRPPRALRRGANRPGLTK